MSTKGVYTALSGALAQSSRLDTIANNIANVNTPTFKKDKQVFNEYLSANEKEPDVIQVPRVPASIESFYDMQGGDRGFVDSAGTFTDFSQGSLKQTGNSLDLGIEGKAFFEVMTPQGPVLTRNGAFKIDSNGLLVTKEGHPVLKSGLGQDPAQRSIQVSSPNVTISYSGEIYDNGQQVAKLSMVDVSNTDALQKVGNSAFRIKNNMDPQITNSVESQVHQGFVEGSNINIVDEMTDMINAQRVFQSTNEAIKAFDSMDSKLVNDVPKTA